MATGEHDLPRRNRAVRAAAYHQPPPLRCGIPINPHPCAAAYPSSPTPHHTTHPPTHAGRTTCCVMGGCWLWPLTLALLAPSCCCWTRPPTQPPRCPPRPTLRCAARLGFACWLLRRTPAVGRSPSSPQRDQRYCLRLRWQCTPPAPTRSSAPPAARWDGRSWRAARAAPLPMHATSLPPVPSSSPPPTAAPPFSTTTLPPMPTLRCQRGAPPPCWSRAMGGPQPRPALHSTQASNTGPAGGGRWQTSTTGEAGERVGGGGGGEGWGGERGRGRLTSAARACPCSGSTGYGRPYRKRLEGEWGVVDVDDW